MFGFLYASVFSLISPKAIFGQRYVSLTLTTVYFSLFCLSVMIWILYVFALTVSNFDIFVITSCVFIVNFITILLFTGNQKQQNKIERILSKYPLLLLKTSGILFIVFCFVSFVITGVFVTILKNK